MVRRLNYEPCQGTVFGQFNFKGFTLYTRTVHIQNRIRIGKRNNPFLALKIEKTLTKNALSK